MRFAVGRNKTHPEEIMNAADHTRSADHAVTAAVPALDADPAAALAHIRTACRANGFALFTVDDPGEPGRSILAGAAQLLGLGDAYIPPVYAAAPSRYGYDADGFNTISPAMATAEHRYFGTDTAQGFHTDGTLDPIGLVATTLLWFERAAPDGGHTTIFQAIAAFEHLHSIDPEGAMSLMSEDALTRVATSFTPPQRATGPAFADLGDGLRTRWADDGTEIWQLAGNLGAHRAAAVERMRRLSQWGSPYRLDLPIPSRTGLVLCNSRVAHGRTPFAAKPGERVLIRGLYTTEVA
jgi:hypothetical protein